MLTKLYVIKKIESDFGICELCASLGIESIKDIPKQELVQHLIDNFRELDIVKHDHMYIDSRMIDTNKVGYRVGTDKVKGYLLRYDNESLMFSYYHVTG